VLLDLVPELPICPLLGPVLRCIDVVEVAETIETTSILVWFCERVLDAMNYPSAFVESKYPIVFLDRISTMV
jgi:hypothetical protein